MSAGFHQGATCGRTTKKGAPCPHPAMANGFCHSHGGARSTPAEESASGYSTDVSQADGLSQEITLLRTMIRDMHEAVKTESLSKQERREYLGTIRTTLDRLARVYRAHSQYELARQKVMTAEQVARFFKDLTHAVVDTIDDDATLDRVLAKIDEVFSGHQPQTSMSDALHEFEPADAPAPRKPLVIPDDDDDLLPRRSKHRKPQDLGVRH